MSTSQPVPSNARILARLLRIAWDHRSRCLLAIGVQVVLLALSVLGAGWSGVAIDVVHHALRPEAPAPRWPWGLSPPWSLAPLQLVLAIAGAITVMAAVRAVLSYVYAVQVAVLVQGEIVPTMRARVYEKLQALSFRFYDRQPSGALLNRVTSDVQYLRSFVDGVMIQALVVLLALVAYGAYMVSIHPLLTLVCLGSTPLLWLVTVRFSRRVLTAHAHARAQHDHLVAGISEAVQGMQVIKGFSVEPHFLDDLVARNRAVRDGQQAIFREVSRFTPSVDFLTQLNTALLLGYGGLLVYRGLLTVGELMAFASLLQQLTTHVSTLSTVVNTLQESLIGARRVFEVLDADLELPSAPAPRPATALRGELHLEQVGFGYEPGQNALSDLSVHIAPGELVALFGPAGAGKSTLLSLIPRFYDVDQGSVRVDGVDVRAYALEDLRRQIAFVFQETFLFSNTVSANIAFGRPEATRAEIEQAARQAAADDFIRKLPHGYDTMLGEHATNLSGGQRQRLAIARALLENPRILLLDDPTAALDAETTTEIAHSLRGAASGRTTLLVTHRPQLLKLADRVLVLEGGRIVQQGSHGELLRRDGPYRRALAPIASPAPSATLVARSAE